MDGLFEFGRIRVIGQLYNREKENTNAYPKVSQKVKNLIQFNQAIGEITKYIGPFRSTMEALMNF